MDVMLSTTDPLDQLAGDIAAVLADDASRTALVRGLRLTPLSLLMSRRTQLVTALAEMPETDRVLRPCWARQDQIATDRLYIWVEAARRRRTRSTGHRSRDRHQREFDCFPLVV